MISEKKSLKKSIFLELKKDIKKDKSQICLDILNQILALSVLKNSSLAHREVPQICVGSAPRNSFAASKTLAAHCICIHKRLHENHVYSPLNLIFPPLPRYVNMFTLDAPFLP